MPGRSRGSSVGSGGRRSCDAARRRVSSSAEHGHPPSNRPHHRGPSPQGPARAIIAQRLSAEVSSAQREPVGGPGSAHAPAVAPAHPDRGRAQRSLRERSLRELTRTTMVSPMSRKATRAPTHANGPPPMAATTPSSRCASGSSETTARRSTTMSAASSGRSRHCAHARDHVLRPGQPGQRGPVCSHTPASRSPPLLPPHSTAPGLTCPPRSRGMDQARRWPARRRCCHPIRPHPG